MWQWLFVIAFMLLTGCRHSGPVARLQQSVATLVGSPVASPDQAPSAIPPPPASDTLQLSIPASILDNLDFLPFSSCAVQATLIKRNSSLGRAAKASQRLLLALEFLQQAPACIEQLQARGDIALGTALRTAWLEQQAQLPARIFNATLASDEYRAIWLVDRAPAEYPVTDPYIATGALRSIDNGVSRWLDGDYRVQNRSLELLLSEIAGGDIGVQSQMLPDHDNAPSLSRTLTLIKALEQRLEAVLPGGYRDWQQLRDKRMAAITTTQAH